MSFWEDNPILIGLLVALLIIIIFFTINYQFITGDEGYAFLIGESVQQISLFSN